MQEITLEGFSKYFVVLYFAFPWIFPIVCIELHPISISLSSTQPEKIMLYTLLLKTESLDNAILVFWLA